MKLGQFSLGSAVWVALLFALAVSACSIDKRGRVWDEDFDAAICGTNACSDGIPCTIDECRPVGCIHAPNNNACDTYPEGVCDPAVGCQYPGHCSEASCFALMPCQLASCVDGTCVRDNSGCP